MSEETLDWVQDIIGVVTGALLGYVLSILSTNKSEKKLQKAAWNAFTLEVESTASDIKRQVESIDRMLLKLSEKKASDIEHYFNNRPLMPDSIDRKLITEYYLRENGDSKYHNLRIKFHSFGVIEYESKRLMDDCNQLAERAVNELHEITKIWADMMVHISENLNSGVKGMYEINLNSIISPYIENINSVSDVLTVQEKVILPMVELNANFPKHPLVKPTNEYCKKLILATSAFDFETKALMSLLSTIRETFCKCYENLSEKPFLS